VSYLPSNCVGLFACGDVQLSPVKRVASAVGEGSMAIALVQQYLQRAAKTITLAPTLAEFHAPTDPPPAAS
jgi:thioredoxin reductase (NADPH)